MDLESHNVGEYLLYSMFRLMLYCNTLQRLQTSIALLTLLFQCFTLLRQNFNVLMQDAFIQTLELKTSESLTFLLVTNGTNNQSVSCLLLDFSLFSVRA